jgi:hypothetical protein
MQEGRCPRGRYREPRVLAIRQRKGLEDSQIALCLFCQIVSVVFA